MPTLSSESQRLLTEATTRYAASIDLAAGYLAGRGIEMSTAHSCQLGVVVDPELGHEGMVGRLAIPYLSRAGVRTIRFRAMDGGDPKYLSLPGVRPHLYNVEALFERSTFIAITEGELDAAVLTHQCGIPAVGCPGVSSWQDHFPRLFDGYDRVLIFADGDTPGREFAKRVSHELDNAIVVNLGDGLDVNDLYVLEGLEGLRKRAGL